MKLLLLIVFLFSSCASAKFEETVFKEKIFEKCSESYHGIAIPNYKKMFCNPYCYKWKFLRKKIPDNCKKDGWKVEIIDPIEYHESLKAGQFILISLDNLDILNLD